jgi:hypothetical protein
MAEAVDAYFAEISLADELRKAGKPYEALDVALRNLHRIPDLITQTVTDYGSFDIGSLPPIETGCTLAAVLDDQRALEEIEAMTLTHPELGPFRRLVAQGHEDLETVRSVRAHVATHPGCLQSTLGKTLGTDGRRTSGLIHQLVLAGMITRRPESRSYALFPTETSRR